MGQFSRHSTRRPSFVAGLLAVMAWSLLVPGGDARATQAMTGAFGSASCGPGNVEGWRFTPNTNIVVDALQVYDHDGNGMEHAVPVGIYDSSCNLVTSATVPAGTSTTFIRTNTSSNQGYRQVLITPVTLLAGVTYRLAAVISCYDWAPYASSLAAVSFDSRIAYSGPSRRPFATTLQCPNDLSGSGHSFAVNFRIVVCGDGVQQQTEDCDDSGAPNNCCSATCQYEVTGTACQDGDACTTSDTCVTGGTCAGGTPVDCEDGNVCTTNTCNPVTGCVSSNSYGNSCDDGNACTSEDYCAYGSCHGGDATDCNDGDLCTQDSCDPDRGCLNPEEPADAGECRIAPGTKLQIVSSTDPAKQQVSWMWNHGDAFDQAALGTPLATTDYALCVYDTSSGVSSLAASLRVAASATLWEDKAPKGLLYKDKAGSSEGVTKLQLKTGEAGKTKVKLSAKGAGVTLPGPAGATYLEQSPKVVAQLRSSQGACWSSEFVLDDTSKNDGTSFKAQTK